MNNFASQSATIILRVVRILTAVNFKPSNWLIIDRWLNHVLGSNLITSNWPIIDAPLDRKILYLAFSSENQNFLWLGSLLENDQNFISRTCTGKFEFFTSRVSTVKIKNFISGVSKVKFRNFISRVSTRKFKIFISRVAKWKIHHVKIEQKSTNIFVRFFFEKLVISRRPEMSDIKNLFDWPRLAALNFTNFLAFVRVGPLVVISPRRSGSDVFVFGTAKVSKDYRFLN